MKGREKEGRAEEGWEGGRWRKEGREGWGERERERESNEDIVSILRQIGINKAV